MSRTVFSLWMLVMFAISLGGCGLAQTVSDGTASSARGIFHAQVKTLRLALDARPAPSLDAMNMDMEGLSVPTWVRVYQLRDGKAVERATYHDLLTDDDGLLGSALLDKRVAVVRAGEGASLNVPMDKGTRVVAVMGLFHSPDTRTNSWRLMLTRDDFAANRARVIELGVNGLTLRALAKE